MECEYGRTGTNAFPYVNAFSLQVPDGTLSEQFPVDVGLPNTRCIADDRRHVCTIVSGIQFRERGGYETREEWSQSVREEAERAVLVCWKWCSWAGEKGTALCVSVCTRGECVVESGGRWDGDKGYL
jgi:hypothetical protein